MKRDAAISAVFFEGDCTQEEIAVLSISRAGQILARLLGWGDRLRQRRNQPRQNPDTQDLAP